MSPVIQVSDQIVECGSFESIEKVLKIAAGEDFVKNTNIAATLAGHQFIFSRFFSVLRVAISKHNESLTGSVNEKELNKLHLISVLQALAPDNNMNAALLFHHLSPEVLK